MQFADYHFSYSKLLMMAFHLLVANLHTYTSAHICTSTSHIPGEEESFLFQVVVQPFLNVIQHGLKASKIQNNQLLMWLLLLLFTFLSHCKFLPCEIQAAVTRLS